MKSNQLEGITHTVYLTTNGHKQCEHCSASTGGDHEIAQDINHYIQEHKYKLLHVGQETTADREYKPIQCTVALLGR